MYVERQVRSQEVTVSGSGVWALSSAANMMDWWRSGATKNVRIRNAKVEAGGSAGDPELEAGPALLTSLNNSRTKGQKVTADISIEFDGVPSLTTKT